MTKGEDVQRFTKDAKKLATRAQMRIKNCLQLLKPVERTTHKQAKPRGKGKKKLSKRALAVAQLRIPPKLDDPGSFIMPCIIACMKFDKVMLDLGSSINVLPSYLYDRMKGLGELKKSKIPFRHLRPLGYVKNIIVHVNDLKFPTDFHVLKMEEKSNNNCQILLGRSFMRTAKTKIDVFNGTFSVAVDDDRITFHLQRVTKET